MKRILSIIILAIVTGLSVFSQSPVRLVSLREAYPVTIGKNTVGGLEISNNGLYMYDILQDSLPQYEIGHIDNQTVRYTENGHGFYVKADSLHSLNIDFDYIVDNPPKGTIEFNEKTGRFKYYPVAEDYLPFTVTFYATSGNERISEDVVFSLMPQTLSETSSFRTQGVLPSAYDYIVTAETSKTTTLNNEQRTAYSISVSGVDVIFDDALNNKVWGLNGREDIYELNIFAERIIVRSALKFPQTNVSIYANELIFEDGNGGFASINTTPSRLATLSNGSGLKGADAGNISLYINKFKGDLGKRLILNGCKGQSSNRNGHAGNGGNGGIVISTIELADYCDFSRGSGGVKFDVASDGSFEAGQIIGAGENGENGHFEYVDKPHSYLHSYFVSCVLRYATDAYINNYTDLASKLCKSYRTLIEDYMNSDEWQNCETENKVALQNSLIEINSMLIRLDQDLDYFGNPVGWVPLLSFEVMLTNFDNEIDRAVPTLYMYYWMNNIDQTLENKVEASEFAARTSEQEIERNQSFINSLVLEMPVLQDRCAELTREIDDLTQQAEQIRNHLLSKAKHNVKKRNRINKSVGICKNIINCIPVANPLLNTISNIAFAAGTASNLMGVDDHGFTSVFENAGSVNYQDILKNLSSAIDTCSWENLGKDANLLKSSYESLNESIAPLISSMGNLNKLLSKSSTPQNEVDAELQRLLAESVEFNQIINQIQDLNQQKISLINRLVQINNDIYATVTEIGSDVISLDAFRRDVFSGNSKRDLNAMLYIEKMEQRAKNRLLKYHYYLRKAYEYRLLTPWEGEFNLVGMFERFESLGKSLDGIIDEAAYSSLGTIFRDVVSEMAEKIIDDYSVNYPEQSAPVSIVLNREQLDIINSGDGLPINLHEMGVFASDEENIRIVDLGIQHIKTHIDGAVGYSGYMDLNMTHSGLSQFRKDGHIYWFDHMSRTTTSPHTWGIRYDAVSQETTVIQPSAASSSLLSSIIGNENNIMLFSRPSAWSDITLQKKVHTSGGGNVVVDSLVLRLKYDFTRRPNAIRNIDITTSDNFMPYIVCSESDINGRDNGNGNLYRSYRMSSQPVTFSAINKYGSYYFLNWSDRAGNIVSEKRDLTVPKSKDQFFIANYERRVPILQVPDTIRVGYVGGEYSVVVDNIGSGDVDMDWYVSDSGSSWVHLKGVSEGVNRGSFTFEFEPNSERKNRVDSIEIIAPETDVISKKIHIVQVDESDLGVDCRELDGINIRIYPVPMKEYVTVEGKNLRSIQIYSIAGQEMFKVNVNEEDKQVINVSNLPNGLYIIIVRTNDGVTSRKITKFS